MTGFARVRKTIPEGEIVLSVKSVNHRALDLHFHLPPELDPFEAALRKAIKGRVARGHLQIHVSFTPPLEAAGAALNKPMMAAYLSAFQQAAAEFGLSGKARSQRRASHSRHDPRRGHARAEAGDRKSPGRR